MTEEENDMPEVLPDAHELIGSYEGLEMSDQAEVARAQAFDAAMRHVSETLDELMTIMADRDTFKLSLFSTPEDRRTIIQVQSTMLENLGILRDSMTDLQKTANTIHSSNRQLLRNTAGIVRLAINTYMAMEVPEQDLSAPLNLAPIDLINPVLPRDARTYENRNMPRAADSATGHFNEGVAENAMYNPNGGLQMSML
jgi:hypothetical protein